MPDSEWTKKGKPFGFHLWNKIWKVLNSKCLEELLWGSTLLPALNHRDTLWLEFLIVFFRCWIILWLLKTIIAKPNNERIESDAWSHSANSPWGIEEQEGGKCKEVWSSGLIFFLWKAELAFRGEKLEMKMWFYCLLCFARFTLPHGI